MIILSKLEIKQSLLIVFQHQLILNSFLMKYINRRYILDLV